MRGLPLVFMSLALLCGCTSVVTIKTRALKFDSPEVAGKRSVDFSSMVSNSPEVHLGHLDTAFLSPSTYTLVDQNEIYQPNDYMLRLGYGLSPCIDVFAESVLYWGLKLGLVGCDTDTGNTGLRIAASLAAGKVWERDSAESGSSSHLYNTLESGWTYDGSLNIGYRFNPYVLVYSNLLASRYNVDVKFTHNDTTLLTKSSTGTLMGVLPGVQINLGDPRAALFFEGGYTHIEWQRIPAKWYTSLGGGVRVRW